MVCEGEMFIELVGFGVRDVAPFGFCFWASHYQLDLWLGGYGQPSLQPQSHLW